MQTIIEGSLTFTFPDHTVAEKYDDWSFYKNQFSNSFDGIKAIDILHVVNNQTWLIEVKDYRRNRRVKIIELGNEVAFKVHSTLAGLAAARCNANDAAEKDAANKALTTQQIRVVLHLEQPNKPSKLFPQVADPAKLTQKLKQLLKPIDAHPKVIDQDNLCADMNWAVTG